MTTVTLEVAQAKLPELIEHLAAGEELLITRNERPIARLTAAEEPVRKPRKAGSAKGMLKIIADDDDHLKDFEEYMGSESCSILMPFSGSYSTIPS